MAFCTGRGQSSRGIVGIRAINDSVRVMMNTGYFFSLERPLHALPGQSQVKTANLHRFSELVSRLGGDHRSLLERYEIDPRVVEDQESFLECRSMVELFEYCAGRFNQPLFGMQLAQLQEPGVYGIVAALCGAAPDLREAIRCFVDYIPIIHSSESVLELVEGPDMAELRSSERSDMGVNDQANLQGLLVNMKMLRTLGGPSFVSSSVNVPGQLPEMMVREIERIMGCNVRTRSGSLSIVFPSRLLDMPVTSANQPLFQLLDGYLSQLKGVSRQRSIVDEVSDYVRETLGVGDISVESCAKALGISPRTLQFRLRAERVSYSAILDRQRQRCAENILRTTGLAVSDIADRLGYSERTSFGRAFKRWTSLSPQQFREQVKANRISV